MDNDARSGVRRVRASNKPKLIIKSPIEIQWNLPIGIRRFAKSLVTPSGPLESDGHQTHRIPKTFRDSRVAVLFFGLSNSLAYVYLTEPTQSTCVGLIALSMTSRLMRNVTTALLYRTVSLSNVPQIKAFLRTMKQRSSLSSPLSRHIRRFSITDDEKHNLKLSPTIVKAITSIFSQLSNLRFLELLIDEAIEFTDMLQHAITQSNDWILHGGGGGNDEGCVRCQYREREEGRATHVMLPQELARAALELTWCTPGQNDPLLPAHRAASPCSFSADAASGSLTFRIASYSVIRPDKVDDYMVLIVELDMGASCGCPAESLTAKGR
ncbi:hypothetical protein B0H14DRAFT_2641668 [Mycena olivaceomarginata]|nr:hypothetical protein B0H14DRAFT_2641668 [Mycena olivaceomarginata]